MAKENMWKQYTDTQNQELENLNDRYKNCLNTAKTERECVALGIRMAKEHGYRDIEE